MALHTSAQQLALDLPRLAVLSARHLWLQALNRDSLPRLTSISFVGHERQVREASRFFLVPMRSSSSSLRCCCCCCACSFSDDDDEDDDIDDDDEGDDQHLMVVQQRNNQQLYEQAKRSGRDTDAKLEARSWLHDLAMLLEHDSSHTYRTHTHQSQAPGLGTLHERDSD